MTTESAKPRRNKFTPETARSARANVTRKTGPKPCPCGTCFRCRRRVIEQRSRAKGKLSPALP